MKSIAEIIQEADQYLGKETVEGIITKARQSVHRREYTETFDHLCRAMIGTGTLTRSEEYIILKLLRQWEMNKK